MMQLVLHFSGNLSVSCTFSSSTCAYSLFVVLLIEFSPFYILSGDHQSSFYKKKKKERKKKGKEKKNEEEEGWGYGSVGSMIT